MHDAVPADTPQAPSDARRHWMSVLARAAADELETCLRQWRRPAYQRLRGPESGLVMVRGRAGGGGAPSTWAR